ncbi:hypothetical protein EHS25_007191 [Saitozyma podzolica]|uniref:Zn(2)-C6 fungal-type domain-containing protein n=1 Tax=Saitozyma podzolica TaxID=1890683 RepID=A0A427XMP9_9TREE|nr:hypothetical protein EHS25_007191 [Saitozyma podzolica]
MSRPPPSTAFPPIPRGVQQLPPFPQLLHLKDSPPVRRTSGDTTPTHGGPGGTPSQSSLPYPRSSFGIPSAPSGPLPHPILAGLGGGDRSSAGPEDGGSIAASPEAEDDDDTAYHGAGGATGDEKKRRPHATRRKVVKSCSECRRRKIKFPCGPCILRSDQARCHEVGMAEKNVVASSSRFATTNALSLVAHRLDALEAALVKTGALLPADLEHFLRTMRAGKYGLEGHLDGERRVKKEHPGPSTVDQESVDDAEGASLTLEHLAFGRSRVEGSHSIPHFGSRVVSSVSRSAPNNNYHLARSSLSHGHGSGASGSGSPIEHRKASRPAETLGSARASVKGALGQMRMITDVSHPSRAPVRVMDFLLAEVEERRRPGTASLGKRKASSPSPDADDGVKKLIQQAALEAESPPQPSTGTPTSNARQSISPYQEPSRDRPVFDAYPAPIQALAPSFTFEPMSQQRPNGPPGGSTTPQDGNGVAGLQIPATQTYQQLSPITFPIDPTTNSYAPNMAFLPPTQTPQLDQAVASMLASYFPQNPRYNAGGMAGPATVPLVPDNFLSRVFSFSWENNHAANGNGSGDGGAGGNAQGGH